MFFQTKEGWSFKRWFIKVALVPVQVQPGAPHVLGTCKQISSWASSALVVRSVAPHLCGQSTGGGVVVLPAPILFSSCVVVVVVFDVVVVVPFRNVVENSCVQMGHVVHLSSTHPSHIVQLQHVVSTGLTAVVMQIAH